MVVTEVEHVPILLPYRRSIMSNRSCRWGINTYSSGLTPLSPQPTSPPRLSVSQISPWKPITGKVQVPLKCSTKHYLPHCKCMKSTHKSVTLKHTVVKVYFGIFMVTTAQVGLPWGIYPKLLRQREREQCFQCLAVAVVSGRGPWPWRGGGHVALNTTEYDVI